MRRHYAIRHVRHMGCSETFAAVAVETHAADVLERT
jgi:hypothetical protein